MNRRNLIRIGAALIPAGMLTSRATAAELQPLMLDDPIAIALGYVEDGSLVDTARYPKKAGPDGDRKSVV